MAPSLLQFILCFSVSVCGSTAGASPATALSQYPATALKHYVTQTSSMFRLSASTEQNSGAEQSLNSIQAQQAAQYREEQEATRARQAAWYREAQAATRARQAALYREAQAATRARQGGQTGQTPSPEQGGNETQPPTDQAGSPGESSDQISEQPTSQAARYREAQAATRARQAARYREAQEATRARQAALYREAQAATRARQGGQTAQTPSPEQGNETQPPTDQAGSPGESSDQISEQPTSQAARYREAQAATRARQAARYREAQEATRARQAALYREAQAATRARQGGQTGQTPNPEQGNETQPPADGGGMADQKISGSSVVSFRAISQDDRSQQDVPVTIGQVFARGAIPEGQTVAAVVDGQGIPTQVDKKATWPDGSLRHAVISVRLSSLDAGAHPSVTFKQAEPANTGSAVTLRQLLGTGFDAETRIRNNGKEYVASARAFLVQASQTGNCSDWGKACKRWLSGPLVSEWIVGGPVRAGGNAHPHLNVYFHVRAYADGNGAITRARVDTVIENNWTYAPKPRNETYDVTLRVGDRTFKVDDLTHYRQARWHKVLWWQGKPDVYARVDTNYIQSTGAVSRYADLTPSDAFLDSVRKYVDPMTNGDQTADMGDPGAQPAIGPLPRWTSTYIVSADPRAFDWMLANDDAVGSYSVHYRDAETGRPLEITRHPKVTIAAISYARGASDAGYKKDLLPSCAGNCGSPYIYDIPHHPSAGYVAYLVTGDFYYLEELQFTASYVELWANARYRGYEKGLLSAQGQVRGRAWALRSLSDAAFITPDDDPLNSYFGQLMTNNLEYFNTIYTDASDADNPLHVANHRGAVIYPHNGQERVGIAPWQQDFLIWAVGHAAEQGFDGAARLLQWFSKFPVETMTNWQQNPGMGYCWLQAAAYSLQIRDVEGGADYPSVNQVYRQNFPDLVGLECNSQEMVNLWAGGRYGRGEMSGYAKSGTGFPSNFQIALAMAKNSGFPNAGRAWQIFIGRRVKPVNPAYRNYPNFAVVPRN